MIPVFLMMAVLPGAAIPSIPLPTEFLSWLYPLQGGLNIVGLSLLVFLFARDLILTKGQHERRVADLVKAHEDAVAAMKEAHTAALAAKDERYAEMKESRNLYRDAVQAVENQKKELADGLIDANRGMAVAATALASLEQVATGRGA